MRPDVDTPSAANLCDAALALGADLRLVTDLRPILPGRPIAGPARCVRHFGSVDIFLECIDRSQPGEILVIDNDGRADEGCIGDLVTLEAAKAGLAGMIVWGRHRDSAELREIGLPVFSLGSCAAGPRRLDPRTADCFGRARLGEQVAADTEWIVADDDGVLIVGADPKPLIAAAVDIRDREAAQAEAMRGGTSIREQLAFREFLAAREADPTLAFRDHLRARRGAIEV